MTAVAARDLARVVVLLALLGLLYLIAQRLSRELMDAGSGALARLTR